ncbi:MAG: stage II sporulation protein M [Acidimicrobiales bacterium]
MNLERFVAERSPDWAELEGLVRRSRGQGRKLAPSEVYRLGALYRFAVADLAVARRSWPDVSGTLRLEALVASANTVVYSKPVRGETAWEFLSTRIWSRIRELDRCLLISAGLLLGFVLLGALWGFAQPSAASGLLPAGFHASAHQSKGAFYGVSIVGRGGLAVQIFVNNIEVAMLAVAGGFTFGLLTSFSLAYNGAVLGILGALEWRGGGFGRFFSLIVPHGLLELSCITLAGAGGLAVARALIDPGNDTRAAALGHLTSTVGAVVLGVVLFLVVAGLTEGIVTPWDLPPSAAFAVGIALAGSFWALVFVRGRPPQSERQPRGHWLQARVSLQGEVGADDRRPKGRRGRLYDHSAKSL